MKKNLTTILTIIISVFAIGVFVYATNTFPTTLNDWDDGDIIESDWADAIEAKIGVNGSAVTSSLDYRLVNLASPSENETITGRWLFNAASNQFSNTLEVGTASVSAFVLPDKDGGDLADCDTGASSKLLWDSTTKKFDCGTDQSASFDATAQDALTWSDGANASNLWTFNLSGTDPTLNFVSGGFSFTGFASISTNFEVGGYASASMFDGTAFGGIDCNDAGDQLLWSAGLFTCETLADGDIPDALTISGGTIGANNISSGVTWTTLGTLTIGDNGDVVNFDTSTWDVSAGVFSGVAGLTSTGTIDFGGATSFEVPNGTDPTFSATGQLYFDTSLEFFKIATQSAGPGAVIPVKNILWSRTVASSAMDFVSGGRMPLPPKPSGWKYVITGIACDVDSGTSAVVNVSNMNGNNDTETVTCDLDGQEDTSIDTNADYTGFTKASSSIEFGTITGSPDYFDITIYGYLRE